MRGMKRAVAGLLGAYLKHCPCVAQLGVRQSGKTTLIKTFLPPGVCSISSDGSIHALILARSHAFSVRTLKTG